MTYNPDYIPAGVNNTDNEYYKTHNNSHIPREWETRALFLGKAAITTTGDPEVTTFDNGGTNYTQILYRQSGGFKTTKEINNASYAIVGGGGSGGNVGQVPGGGGGAEALVFEDVTLPVQDTFIAIGAGAAGALSGNGNKGGTTSWLGISAQGGGYGGGAGAGGDGGNGGGGGGTNGTANSPGGTGDQFNGGAAFGSSTFAERSSGGGGGAGAVGQTASISSAGDGGAGLTLAWTTGAIQISGGGGGSTINGVDNGTATHGGTAGTYGAASANAANGGGSGGTGGSAPNSGNGGDGLVVIVFPTSEAVVQ